jgi:formylglycine-generating enzyme required for sulfatase activity
METKPCDTIGNEYRLCGNDCEWLEWDASDCGECAPGTVDATNQGCDELWEIKQLECDSDGNWNVVTPCTADCILNARTNTNNFSDEVCIPGGPFIMGSDPGVGEDDERPKHTVHLTPYFFDVYEVTVARYRECVQAGVCNEPTQVSNYHEQGSDDIPVKYIDRVDAIAFCNWDGGRSLPTEAQWEKAARGPSPREVLHPWGDNEATCEIVIAGPCISGDFEMVPVDSLPQGVSYYGIYHLADNVSEWCLDYYDVNYYSISPQVDPQGPATGTDWVIRGFSATASFYYFTNTASDRLTNPDSNEMGIRCSRRGY